MLEEWILAFVASPFVYLAVYLATTVDGFFPPVPSESAVIALAALAMSTGVPDVWLLVAVAAAGAFTGDQLAYAIGRRVKIRSTRVLRGRRAQRAVDWAEYALTNRGASFIIGARYIPVGRVAVNMTAGSLGFPRRRFVGLTAVAAVSWAIYSTVIGIGAGAWLHERPVVAIVVGVIAGTVIGLGVDWVLGRVQRRPHLRRLAQRRIAQRRAAQRRASGQGRIARMRRVPVGSRAPRRTVADPRRPVVRPVVPPILPLVDGGSDGAPTDVDGGGGDGHVAATPSMRVPEPALVVPAADCPSGVR